MLDHLLFLGHLLSVDSSTTKLRLTLISRYEMTIWDLLLHLVLVNRSSLRNRSLLLGQMLSIISSTKLRLMLTDQNCRRLLLGRDELTTRDLLLHLVLFGIWDRSSMQDHSLLLDLLQLMRTWDPSVAILILLLYVTLGQILLENTCSKKMTG